MDENTGPGLLVGAAVTADDPDGDTLSYSLGGTHAGSFTIDSGSGRLSTKDGEVYDFETRRVYSVWVSADDGHGGTGRVTVRVELQDVDEPPTISDRRASSSRRTGSERSPATTPTTRRGRR